MILDTALLEARVTRRLVFFRVLGYGVWVASNEAHPPIFSERHGSGRAVGIGSWRLKVLRPDPPRPPEPRCPF
jgi:hypothetical protein